MRKYWTSRADKARDLDFDLPTQLLEWAEDNRISVINEEAYFILCEDDYRVVYSRRGMCIQCYYLGYGYDAISKSLYDFETLEETLEFIESCRDMEFIKTKAMEEVAKEMVGWGARREGKDFDKIWKRKLDEKMGIARPKETSELIQEIFQGNISIEKNN